jgi:uncharacterized protein
MKLKVIAVLSMLIYAGVCAAQATTPASEASIKELLKAMEARQLIDNILPQLQGMMQNSMQQALQGKAPTPEQQQVFDKMQTSVMSIYKEQMDWAHMEPMYIRIYQSTFTQSEIDGMLVFYRSAAGQAMVKKMPLAVQNTMTEMQKLVGPMVQKIQEAAREAQAAAKSSSTSSGSSSAKKPE